MPRLGVSVLCTLLLAFAPPFVVLESFSGTTLTKSSDAIAYDMVAKDLVQVEKRGRDTVVELSSLEDPKLPLELNREASVERGARLIVKLPGNASTGYLWQDKARPEFLEAVELKDEYRVNTGGHSSLVGAPHPQQFAYNVLSSGSGTVEFFWGRPWENQTRTRLTLSVSVTERTVED